MEGVETNGLKLNAKAKAILKNPGRKSNMHPVNHEKGNSVKLIV